MAMVRLSYPPIRRVLQSSTSQTLLLLFLLCLSPHHLCLSLSLSLRCHHALGDWETLGELARETWSSERLHADSTSRAEVARLARACGHWDEATAAWVEATQQDAPDP